MSHDAYLHYTIKWFPILGMRRLNTDSLTKKILHHSLRCFCRASLVIMMATLFIDIMERQSYDFTGCALNIFYNSIYMGSVVRLNYYYFFDDKVEKIMEKVKFFKFETKTGLDEKNMKGYIEFAYKIAIGLMSMDVLTVEVFNLLPFLEMKHHRSLPLSAWYPFDWTASPVYELMYVVQIFFQTIMIWCHITSDVFFMSLMYLTSAQFELLGWEFRNICYTALLKSGIPKDKVELFRLQFGSSFNTGPRAEKDELFIKTNDQHTFDDIEYTMTTEKFSNIVIKEINSLIEFHQELVTYCDTLEDFFSPVLLLGFGICMGYVTFLGFTIVTAENTKMVLTFGEYIVAAIIQAFLITYFGQLITLKSDELLFAVYDSPWYLCNRRFKSTFKIVHFCVSKSVVITLGKFADLNFNSFLTIMKTCFSYLAVLRRVTEGDE